MPVSIVFPPPETDLRAGTAWVSHTVLLDPWDPLVEEERIHLASIPGVPGSFPTIHACGGQFPGNRAISSASMMVKGTSGVQQVQREGEGGE